MVWNTSDSPLYRAVESFNNSTTPAAPRCEPKKEQPCADKCECAAAPPCCDEPKLAPHNAPPQRPQQYSSPLQALFGDKDMLLVAALIIILIHEKADMKIILALGLILLM